MSAQDCHLVQGALLAHRAGELSPMLAAAVAEHLASCDACARIDLRLRDMLGAARELDAAAQVGDADALFDRIVTATPQTASLELDGVREEVAPGIADADALFARIVAEATSAPLSDPLPARESFAERARASSAADEDLDEAEVIAFPARRWWPAAFALAAVALAAFAVVSRGGSGPVADAGLASLEAPAMDEVRPALPSPTLAAALDEAARAGDDAVRVFAEPDARWSLSGDGERVLRLEEGTVLVEFVPLDGATLRVEAPGYEVRVVGTVFYASTALDAPVGVLTGAVEVSAGADTARVESGEEWTGSDVSALSAQERGAMRTHVDEAAHGARLEDAAATAASSPALASSPARESFDEVAAAGDDAVAAADSTPARESFDEVAAAGDDAVAAADSTPARESFDEAAAAAPSPAPSPARESFDEVAAAGEDAVAAAAPSPAPSPARESFDATPEADDDPAAPTAEPDAAALVEEGRRAARDGRDRDAVAALEAALAALPGGDVRAATLRLDLARMYAHQLDQPASAARHLRAFLADWPDDVAAGAALDELCRVTTALGAPDVRCDGGDR